MAASATSRQGAEEASLATAFARRESWAFDEAYRRYGALLFSVALNVLHNAEDAEDCVHDVLVRVWKTPHAFAAQRGSVRGFLVVCVRNDAISRQRSAARRAKLAERIEHERESVEEIDIADFVEQARVRAALAHLPQEQRAALTLAYFGGKTHVEIAHILGEPLGTIKSRISMGLRKLGNALSGSVT
ncbi:MAG TPA: sigma-70 family RNA polymerase sigma factor [Candidatus Baltobacteraceae bacterium]|jgi:RNA polymerase sigma-70 factor (ECF subfamily)|nr:sigma-70 family RNA polymerase sigma factor [Candidatus Baltobacteraceae bacterium]